MGNVFGRTRTTWERTFTTSFAAGSLLGFELPDHWMVAELQLQLPSFLVMSVFFDLEGKDDVLQYPADMVFAFALR